MDHADHVALLRDGVARPGGTWADIGAGSGAFTLALADLLGPGATIVAVDRDAAALRTNTDAVASRFPGVRLTPIVADFTSRLDLPPLDGLVAANSLHYVARDEQPEAIRRLAGHLRPGGTFIVVEYDADRGNPWVPHPWSAGRWPSLAEAAGLVEPGFLHRVPSRFLGGIYAASARRASASTSASTSDGST
jgi:SAM-dependent methyltransferase